MGNLGGWSGARQEPEASRLAVEKMLDPCCRSDSAVETAYDNDGGLGISKGLYPTSLSNRDNIKAALIGTPQWNDSHLGEIANDQGLAASLIHAYKKYGEKLLARLHGPFALAIIHGNTSLLAIDRVGIHNLNFTCQNGVLVFATSTDSVTSHPRINRVIDPQAVFNYFFFHDVPSPGSIYSGVEKLLPAQFIRFRDGQLEKGFYWELHYNDNEPADFQPQKELLNSHLRHSVSAASRDGRCATFLSGGTDSSTVTGVLAELSTRPVDAYSIGFNAEGFDEMQYARLAAQHFGANLNEYYLNPDDILEAIPLIASTYDEPFANESAIPAYFCAKRAAENGVKVMLAGDGGDEIFGGNERYAKQMVFEHYGHVPGFIRKYIIEPMAFGIPGGDALMPTRKLRSYIRQARTPLPERMESYNFIYRQPLEEVFEAGFLASVDTGVPEALMREVYTRADADNPVNRMMHLDMKFTLADNDLRKVSRMCEAAGIEVRYPLLDEALVEFAAQLPASFKIRGQKLRWFFKEALRDFLPDEIINKSKHGFGLPFGLWALSHAPLKALVEETLDRFEGRGYIRPGYIHTLRKLHAGDHPTYYGKMIWAIFMLEQWLSVHSGNHN